MGDCTSPKARVDQQSKRCPSHAMDAKPRAHEQACAHMLDNVKIGLNGIIRALATDGMEDEAMDGYRGVRATMRQLAGMNADHHRHKVMQDCFNLINQTMGTRYNSWQDVFAAELDGMLDDKDERPKKKAKAAAQNGRAIELNGKAPALGAQSSISHPSTKGSTAKPAAPHPSRALAANGGGLIANGNRKNGMASAAKGPAKHAVTGAPSGQQHASKQRAEAFASSSSPPSGATTSPSSSSSPAVTSPALAASAGKTVWEATLEAVEKELRQIDMSMHFIHSYTSGWRGRSKDFVQPEGQIKDAQRKVKRSKERIKQLLEELRGRYAEYTQVLQNIDDDDDDALENVPCSVCGSEVADDDNDILMCDGHDCHRAFHQACLDPPLTKDMKALLKEDDLWLCWKCNCLDDCLRVINEKLDTAYETVDEVFAEAKATDSSEVWSSEEESSDEDYTPKAPRRTSATDSDDDEEEEEEEGEGGGERSRAKGRVGKGVEDEDGDEEEEDEGGDDDAEVEEDDDDDGDEGEGGETDEEEEEESSEDASGESEGSSSEEEEGEERERAKLIDADDAELRALLQEVKEEELLNISCGAGRPKRKAFLSCNSAIDSTLEKRGRPKGLASRGEELVGSGVARVHGAIVAAGLILAYDADTMMWTAVYEDELEATLMATDVEQGMQVYEVYKRCAEREDTTELNEFIQTRVMELTEAAARTSSEEVLNGKKDVLRQAVKGADVISLGNVIHGKRRRGADGGASSGVLASIAPVTFGLVALAGEDLDDDSGSDYEEDKPASRAKAKERGKRQKTASDPSAASSAAAPYEVVELSDDSD